MTPTEVNGTPTDVQSVDEYVHTDLRYLSLLRRPQSGGTLVAMVGVQSHQFHRALDLAACARRNGCMAVIGGPHVMTCDTTPLQGHGVSFAQAEAELVWLEILKDAADGDLKPVYGREAGCFQMFVGVESFNRQTLLAAKKGQNRPDTYRDIVRLCRAHAISSHFSNIIGFPQDTEREVHEHLEVLRALSPTWVSFYVLCPIPGTEQYDDFMAAGLVTEKNLDRFDTTCLTWRHPFFSPEQLSELLFACYRKFFSLRHALRNLRDLSPRYGNGILGEMMGSVAMSLFSRHCAWRRTHPMSGGVARCGWTA
jgi:hypothetical protein